MGLGDKLIDQTYKPSIIESPYTNTNFFNRIVKLNVKFTNDPFEYIEGYIGYKLRPFQREVIEDLFSLDPNGIAKYDVSIMVIGMRSGKTLISSVVGSFLLHKLLQYDDPAGELGQIPHYKLSGVYLANSADQSQKTSFASLENIIATTPWWRKYINDYLLEREKKEGSDSLFVKTQKRIFFPEKNLEAISLTSSSSSGAGTTSYFFSAEELSRADVSTGIVQGTTEKRTAQAVYYTFSRATKTLSGFSKTIVSTSCLYESDFAMQLLYMSKDFKCGENKSIMDSLRLKYFPNKVDKMIAYNYATWEANAKTLDNPYGFLRSDFNAEFADNTTAAMRDFGSIPPGSTNPLLEYPERIDACINSTKKPVVLFSDKFIEQTINGPDGFEARQYIAKDVYPQMHDKITSYFLACDQGKVSDSFCISMGHCENFHEDIPIGEGKFNTVEKFKIIIDFIEEWKPNKQDRITVSFQNVEDTIRILSQYFNIKLVVYDQWNSVESIERLFAAGLKTEQIGSTIKMYEVLKMLIYSNMIEIPNDNTLITELRQLNIVHSHAGNPRVDHPVGGSKDFADSLVRTAFCIYNDSVMNAVNGNYMLPIVERFSTVRSAGSFFQENKQAIGAPAGQFGSSSNIWSQSKSGTIVRSNIMSSINSNNFKRK